MGVAKFLKYFEDAGTIARKPGSGRSSKVTKEIKGIVSRGTDAKGQQDNSTPAISCQGIWYISTDHPSLSIVSQVDILGVYLLLNVTRREEATVGARE